MLYSTQYIRNKRDERRLFYADSNEAALENIRAYAQKNELNYEFLHIEKHPSGLWHNGKFFPAGKHTTREKKRERT